MTLPDAIERERDHLLDATIIALRNEGYRDLRVHEFGPYPDPPSLRIPILNTDLHPDIAGTSPAGEAFIACIEVSSNLSETDGGRRWQALSAWANQHHAAFRIFVHAADEPRAREIARYWQIDRKCLRPIFSE